MAVFGILKGTVSREPVANGYMVLYSKPNGFCVVFFLYQQPLRSRYSPIISFLGFTRHVEVSFAHLLLTPL